MIWMICELNQLNHLVGITHCGDDIPLFRPRLETSCHTCHGVTLSSTGQGFHLMSLWELGGFCMLGRWGDWWGTERSGYWPCGWHPGVPVAGRLCVYICVYIYIYIYIFFFLAVLGLHCCRGFSLIWGSTSYSPVVGHRFLIAGASHCGSRATEHRLTVVSQGLSCSHMWDLLKPGSSAALTSYVRKRVRDLRGMFAIGV